MEVRTRDGVLLGHAANYAGHGISTIRRLESPDSLMLSSFEAFEEVKSEIVHFDIRKGVCIVDDQDPYLLPGFIPRGQSIGIEVSMQVDDSFRNENAEAILHNHAARQLAEAILLNKLQFHSVKNRKGEWRANHRFSVYITVGA